MTLSLSDYEGLVETAVWFAVTAVLVLAEWHEDRHVNDEKDDLSRNAGKTLFREN